MMENKVYRILFCLAIFQFGRVVYASQESTGPNGINSSGLGLTGNGVGIGQVELSRPGDPKNNSQPGPPYPDFDTITALLNDAIDPERVFYTTVDPNTGVASYAATENAASETGTGHPTWIAGVIISTDVVTAGVAPQADLFSSGYGVDASQDPLDIVSVAAQHVATSNGGNVSAINMSFFFDLAGGDIPDGSSKFSSFVDWSARVHDVLYVAAGPYTSLDPGTANGRLPADNFNGITVAMSKKDSNGKYNIVDDRNIFLPNPWSPLTERTFTDLLAPGDENILLALNGNDTGTSFGTSLAAPHVTGTVALLQEYANPRVDNSVPGWNPVARHHEVMKAVLMNSADKINDDGALAPVGAFLGMERTVLDTSGNNWLSTDALFDEFLPLDIEMGAGHLNAKRALDQFSPGEYDPDGATVPVVGWDFHQTTGLGDINKYALDQELLAGSYISITLAWDREVTFDNEGATAGVFESGDTFNGYSEVDADDVSNDLDLFLMPKGATDLSEYIWSSGQDFMPLEHIFFSIQTTGEYEIWVHQFDADLGGGQEYGLAWWAKGTGPTLAGDFDDDGDVDGADFLAWQRDPNVGSLSDWENNFGGAPSAISGDFDNDGDVDGADFLAWQRDPNVGSLMDWKDNFGNSAAVASAGAVPEPATGLLLLTGVLVVPRRYTIQTINNSK